MNAEFEHNAEGRDSLQSFGRVTGGRLSFAMRLVVLVGVLCLGWPGISAHRTEVIDRLMAVVNRQIITLGDVEQELKMQVVDPTAGVLAGVSSSQQEKMSQEVMVQRLIEQTLIREQIQQFPGLEINDEQVESQLASVENTKEIEAYYQNQFLPELQKRNVVPAPVLPDVEERIRKIVTEEKLNTQVDEWLASLRKDATIEIFH